MTTADFPAALVLGYPRIGPARELKRAVEAHWAGRTTAAELADAAAELRAATRARLRRLGLTEPWSIPSDFSYYDHMLDAAVMLGAVPSRFAGLLDDEGGMDLAGYFTLARGEGEHLPLEMTKWFDSNYHYLVPEIGPDTAFRLAPDSHVEQLAAEAAADGVAARPVLVGPVTFLALAKAAEGAPAGFRPLDRLDDVVACYLELAARLARQGVGWLQLDEPALVADLTGCDRDELVRCAGQVYSRLAAAAARPALFVAAPYGPLDEGAGALAAAGVEAIGLDLVRGRVPAAVTEGALRDTIVVAGLVDGHNVWRTDLTAALQRLQELAGSVRRLSVGTSTSLLHVPHDVATEADLPPELASWLAFADQKVAEVSLLAAGLAEPSAVADALAANRAVLAARTVAPGVRVAALRERIAAIGDTDRRRAPYAQRRAAQAAALELPPLPTTTIGSFPQTPQIRLDRAAHRRGELSDTQYEDAMRREISRVVSLQEDIGLDVLVHGEAERNDMVQYFAEQLDGCAVTDHGWVQSYGTRCTRPPIVWGDVTRPRPMTVEWARYAQSLTEKPMKGMLTGPVTILAWSFVRDDQPLGDTATQVALALRDEIADLEGAGLTIVQVDEPALRELLPLRAADRPQYLAWSVGAFRLATAVARPATQIHTHLCYSEFGDVIDAIDNLDADVTSIEAARSKMEVVPAVAASGFERGIGPGVYDIHSPRIPTEREITQLLTIAVHALSPQQLWVNPDCGLKTRGYGEVVPSLTNMVAAAARVREGLSS